MRLSLCTPWLALAVVCGCACARVCVHACACSCACVRVYIYLMKLSKQRMVQFFTHTRAIYWLAFQLRPIFIFISNPISSSCILVSVGEGEGCSWKVMWLTESERGSHSRLTTTCLGSISLPTVLMNIIMRWSSRHECLWLRSRGSVVPTCAHKDGCCKSVVIGFHLWHIQPASAGIWLCSGLDVMHVGPSTSAASHLLQMMTYLDAVHVAHWMAKLRLCASQVTVNRKECTSFPWPRAC